MEIFAYGKSAGEQGDQKQVPSAGIEKVQADKSQGKSEQDEYQTIGTTLAFGIVCARTGWIRRGQGLFLLWSRRV